MACTTTYALWVRLYRDPITNEILTPGAIGAVPMQWIALLVVTVVLGLAVSAFAVYCVYLAARNETVLENLEVVRYRTLLPAGSFRYSMPPTSATIGNVFDLHSIKANLGQILGHKPYHWFLPFHPKGSLLGDGTWFPINRELFEQAQSNALNEHVLLDRQYRYRRSQRTLMRSDMISVNPYITPSPSSSSGAPSSDPHGVSVGVGAAVTVPVASAVSNVRASSSRTPSQQTGFVSSGSNYYQEELDSLDDNEYNDLEYYMNPKEIESIPLTRFNRDD